MAAVSGAPDPAAYRAELRHVASGVQRLGFVSAGLGVLAAVLRGTVLPGLPELVPLALIVTALGLMLIGTVRRMRYHWRRMRALTHRHPGDGLN